MTRSAKNAKLETEMQAPSDIPTRLRASTGPPAQQTSSNCTSPDVSASESTSSSAEGELSGEGYTATTASGSDRKNIRRRSKSTTDAFRTPRATANASELPREAAFWKFDIMAVGLSSSSSSVIGGLQVKTSQCTRGRFIRQKHNVPLAELMLTPLQASSEQSSPMPKPRAGADSPTSIKSSASKKRQSVLRHDNAAGIKFYLYSSIIFKSKADLPVNPRHLIEFQWSGISNDITVILPEPSC